MSIWKKPLDLQIMNAMSANTAVAHLGIEITEIGEDTLTARMPVDARTHQPFGLLHGGCSVVLAETVGSMAAYGASEEGRHVVGLDINANHIRPVSAGWVIGTARPVHLGRSTHVWQIDIVDERGALVCVSRLTAAILGA